MESEPVDHELCHELLTHYNAIRGCIARTVACPHLVEDLVQETYQRALRYGRDRTASRACRAWLRTIARHVICDHYKDWAARRAQEFIDELTSLAVGSRNLDDRPDLLGYAREDLANAIAALRPEARALILAFYFKGNSTGEIAKALGIGRAEVRVRLYRVRRKLRNYLINPREVCDD